MTSFAYLASGDSKVLLIFFDAFGEQARAELAYVINLGFLLPIKGCYERRSFTQEAPPRILTVFLCVLVEGNLVLSIVEVLNWEMLWFVKSRKLFPPN